MRLSACFSERNSLSIYRLEKRLKKDVERKETYVLDRVHFSHKSYGVGDNYSERMRLNRCTTRIVLSAVQDSEDGTE